MRRKFLLLGMISMLLAGCGGTAGIDVQGTLVAGDAQLAEEIATLNSSSFAYRTEVSQMVTIKETELAQISGQNQMIGATLAAGATPTHVLQLGIAEPDRDREKYQEFMAGRNVNPTLAGSSYTSFEIIGNNINSLENRGGTTNFMMNSGQLARLGVASRVDAVDCPADAGTTFSRGVSRLYVVMRANGLPAGAPLAVTWYYGEEIRAQDTWATPRDFNNVCIWFVLESSRTPFTAGEWSVQLFAYNQPLEDRLRFTLTD